MNVYLFAHHQVTLCLLVMSLGLLHHPSDKHVTIASGNLHIVAVYILKYCPNFASDQGAFCAPGRHRPGLHNLIRSWGVGPWALLTPVKDIRAGVVY